MRDTVRELSQMFVNKIELVKLSVQSNDIEEYGTHSECTEELIKVPIANSKFIPFHDLEVHETI